MIWFSYLSTNQAYESCSVRTNVVHSIPSFSGQILLWTKWANSPFLFIVMYMGWVLSQSLDGQSMSFTGHCPWATPRVNFCHILNSPNTVKKRNASVTTQWQRSISPHSLPELRTLSAQVSKHYSHQYSMVAKEKKKKKKKETYQNSSQNHIEAFSLFFPSFPFIREKKLQTSLMKKEKL